MGMIKDGMCSMDYDDIAKMIKRHEGGPHNVYLDSVGVPTCGWGHALHVGSEVPAYIAERFFYLDFKKAIEDYNRMELHLDTVRKAVIIDMLFNLGYKGLMKFKNMIAALRSGDYEKAADEMMDSKWHGQVGLRALELENMMRDGGDACRPRLPASDPMILSSDKETLWRQR
uniref:Putative glycoside hydrolase n=1 Tax=viral metagenome TaxID=1070528 RepID=A0A6M3J136_9ZZZZ